MGQLVSTLAEVLVAFVVIAGLAALAKKFFFDKKDKTDGS